MARPLRRICPASTFPILLRSTGKKHQNPNFPCRKFRSITLPQAQRKTWGKLVANGRSEAIALGLDRQPHTIVGTVPVQHSYGFESTFLLALHGGCAFWAGKPFFPQDITCALAAVPQPRLLVTTPFHLSAFLSADIEVPSLDLLLSATAPLSATLAADAEARIGAPTLEIYGSTESGQLASRRTTDGAEWTLLPEGPAAGLGVLVR